MEESLTKIQSQKYNYPDLYYILNIADIYPLEISEFNEEEVKKGKRFRPEFLKFFQTNLSSTSFLASYPTSENEKNDLKSVEASIFLKTRQIELFNDNIAKLKILITNSHTISYYFHSFGINIRFLGLVAEKTQTIYFKEILEIEMIARVLKKLFWLEILKIQKKFILLNFNIEENKSK